MLMHKCPTSASINAATGLEIGGGGGVVQFGLHVPNEWHSSTICVAALAGSVYHLINVTTKLILLSTLL
jgi:hypothetical protein